MCVHHQIIQNIKPFQQFRNFNQKLLPLKPSNFDRRITPTACAGRGSGGVLCNRSSLFFIWWFFGYYIFRSPSIEKLRRETEHKIREIFLISCIPTRSPFSPSPRPAIADWVGLAVWSAGRVGCDRGSAVPSSSIYVFSSPGIPQISLSLVLNRPRAGGCAFCGTLNVKNLGGRISVRRSSTNIHYSSTYTHTHTYGILVGRFREI